MLVRFHFSLPSTFLCVIYNHSAYPVIRSNVLIINSDDFHTFYSSISLFLSLSFSCPISHSVSVLMQIANFGHLGISFHSFSPWTMSVDRFYSALSKLLAPVRKLPQCKTLFPYLFYRIKTKLKIKCSKLPRNSSVFLARTPARRALQKHFYVEKLITYYYNQLYGVR